MNWKIEEIHNSDNTSPYYNDLYHVQKINKCYQNELVDFIKANIHSNNVILNLGSGTGELSNQLKRYYNIIDLDISRLMLVNGNKLSSVQADGENIPFSQKSFDAVICSNTLHHYPELNKVSNEIHRVLKPNGILIIFEPNNKFKIIHKSISPLLYIITGILSKTFFSLYRYNNSYDKVTDHHRDLNHEEIHNSLCKFEEIETISRYYLSPYFVLFKSKGLCDLVMILDKIIHILIPNNGRYLFMSYRKPGDV